MNLPLHSADAFGAEAQPAGQAAQVAAICWRLRGRDVQVLLVTSRGTGRWIVPKGWQIAGHDGAASAATEAWEEAGVRGTVSPDPVGTFSYVKLLDDGGGLPVTATVYALRVRSQLKSWPEMSQRRRRWMSPRKAAALVAEPELAALLAGFAPHKRLA